MHTKYYEGWCSANETITGQSRYDAEDKDECIAKEYNAFHIIINSLDDDNVPMFAMWKFFVFVERYESCSYADVSGISDARIAYEDLPSRHIDAKAFDGHAWISIEAFAYGPTDAMLGQIVTTSCKDVFPVTVKILRSQWANF